MLDPEELGALTENWRHFGRMRRNGAGTVTGRLSRLNKLTSGGYLTSG